MKERVGKSERASAALAAEVAALGQRLGRIQPRVAVARLAVVSAEIQRDARALQHRLHTLLPRLQQVGANSGSGGASGTPGSSTAPPASGGKGRALNHCRIDEPWLSQIVSGAKTFEGRVNRGMWATLARGDILLASSERYKEVELEVTVLHTFADFDGAFEALGTALLPNGAANAVEALALYRQWYSAETVEKAGGVVVVGVTARRVLRAEPPRYMVAALYHFATLEDYVTLRDSLDKWCREHFIKGTLLLAAEGINGTVSGAEDDVKALLAHLKSDPRLAGLAHKESWSETDTHARLKVRLKAEIVTLGVDGVDPNAVVGQYVKPKDWNSLISDPDVVVIDTRNTYEIELGTFAGAEDPKTEIFKEFPEWVAKHPKLKPDSKVAMFCTGGIRCEKASSYMLSSGFKDVYHLEGGILKYLEEVPEDQSMWNGECYVFDRRVSVNHKLEPGSFDTCRACGKVLHSEDKARKEFMEGVACHHCYATTSEKSKNRFAERQRQLERDAAKGVPHTFGQRHEASRQPQHHKR